MTISEMLHRKLGEEDLQLVASDHMDAVKHSSFCGDFMSPSSLIRSAKDQLDALKKAEQESRELVFKPRGTDVVEWMKPTRGYLKASLDAAVNVGDKEWVWG